MAKKTKDPGPPEKAPDNVPEDVTSTPEPEAPVEVDKRAKSREDIVKSIPKAEPAELFKKPKKGRKPKKKEIGLDENAGKMFVAGMDALFRQAGLTGIITEQDLKYFSSVTAGGEVSLAKMYSESFVQFFNKKYKDKIKDFDIFKFYILSMAIVSIKVHEANQIGLFKEISWWTRIKARFSRKPDPKDETVSEEK